MITPKAILHLTLTEPQICSGSKSVPFLSKHPLLYLPQQSVGLHLCAPNPGSESEVSLGTAFLMPVRVGTGTLLLESSIRGRGSRWKPRGSDGQRKWWLRWEPEKFFGFVLCFSLSFIIYLFVAVLGLHCHMGISPVLGSGAYSLVAVCGLLISVSSFVPEHRL